MICETDIVALTKDILDHGLRVGDIGTVVHCYKDGKAFEVEFVNAEGDTIAVLTLDKDSIRPISGREILHVRSLELMA